MADDCGRGAGVVASGCVVMLSYTNRRGVTYFVHEVRTRAGRRRYVAKRVRKGALAELPEGLEIAENVNGQVSVRAARPRAIPPEEEQAVREALERHERARWRVEVKDRDIIVHEPDYDLDGVTELLDPLAGWGVLGPALDAHMRKHVGDAAWDAERRRRKDEARRRLERRMRYSPVLRFRLDDPDRRLFSVERMCYRGEGGWLWLKTGLSLDDACNRYVPLLGTDEMYEEF